MVDMMFDNPIEYVYSLIVDLVIFIVKSVYFWGETIVLTLTPYSLRKLKVGCFYIIVGFFGKFL